MIIEIVVGIVLLFTLCALVMLLRGGRVSANREQAEGLKHPEGPERPEGGTDCPLCGEHLPPGVRVHSARYPGREFDVMHIYGCPNCRPDGGGVNTRRCPCCRDKLPESGYVLAQVYRKSGGKTHVHVVGCSSCSPARG